MTSESPTFRSDMDVFEEAASASDMTVVRAARVSTQGEETRADDDESAALIRFLMRNRHGTPFEHNSFTFFVRAPIFVFREFQRHRIASYNEESGRYRVLAPVFYVPDLDRPLIQVGKAGEYRFVPGDTEQTLLVRKSLESASVRAYETYQEMLGAGIAREVARMCLPVNTYSSMYVTMNARGLMNFLSLRTTSSASQFPSFPQYEIEVVARQMEEIFRQHMPKTWEAFNTHGRVCP